MNWNNLIENNCPLCGSKLKYRPRKRSVKMKVREYKDIDHSVDDFYFCYVRGCKGFQISSHRLKQLQIDKQRENREKLPEDVRKAWNEIMRKVF